VDELERGVVSVGGENGGGGSGSGSPAVVVEEDGLPNKGGKAAANGGRKDRKMLSVRVKSITALRSPSATAGLPTPELTPPGSGDEDLPPMPGAYPRTQMEQESEAGAAHSPRKKAQRKKSFVATIFGRSGSRHSYGSSLPVIADEA
jgi:hypothetical protein